MGYNNQNNEPKPPPSVEYSMKNLSWHLKTISENLAKLTEHLTGNATQAHSNQQRQNPPQQQHYNDNMPF